MCNLLIFRFNALISWEFKEMKLTRGKKCSKIALIGKSQTAGARKGRGGAYGEESADAKFRVFGAGEKRHQDDRKWRRLL